MKKGQFKAKDLQKVADYMLTMVKPEDLTAMMNKPEKKMIALRNAWGRMLEAMNKAGAADAMVRALDGITNAIKEFTPHAKNFYKFFENLFKFLWENKEILIGVYSLFRLWGASLAAISTAKAVREVKTLADIFKVLATTMLRTVAIPAAIIAAILLAVDTIEGFTKKKNSILFDFRENIPEREQRERYTASYEDFITSLSNKKKDGGAFNTVQTQRKANTLLKNLPDTLSVQQKAEFAQQVMESIGGQTAFIDVENLNKIRNDWLLERRLNTAELTGLSSNAPTTINITVQNTEPNVSREWLSTVLPDVLAPALNQHVQKEFSVVPSNVKR